MGIFRSWWRCLIWLFYVLILFTLVIGLWLVATPVGCMGFVLLTCGISKSVTRWATVPDVEFEAMVERENAQIRKDEIRQIRQWMQDLDREDLTDEEIRQRLRKLL